MAAPSSGRHRESGRHRKRGSRGNHAKDRTTTSGSRRAGALLATALIAPTAVSMLAEGTALAEGPAQAEAFRTTAGGTQDVPVAGDTGRPASEEFTHLGCKAPVQGNDAQGNAIIHYDDQTGDPRLAADIEQAAKFWSSSGANVHLLPGKSRGAIKITKRSFGNGGTGTIGLGGCGGQPFVELNGDFTARADAQNRIGLIAHEMGHALGLGHSQGCSLMQPVLRPCGGEVPNKPSQDEVNGIKQLYRKGAPNPGTPGPGQQPGPGEKPPNRPGPGDQGPEQPGKPEKPGKPGRPGKPPVQPGPGDELPGFPGPGNEIPGDPGPGGTPPIQPGPEDEPPGFPGPGNEIPGDPGPGGTPPILPGPGDAGPADPGDNPSCPPGNVPGKPGPGEETPPVSFPLPPEGKPAPPEGNPLPPAEQPGPEEGPTQPGNQDLEKRLAELEKKLNDLISRVNDLEQRGTRPTAVTPGQPEAPGETNPGQQFAELGRLLAQILTQFVQGFGQPGDVEPGDLGQPGDFGPGEFLPGDFGQPGAVGAPEFQPTGLGGLEQFSGLWRAMQSAWSSPALSAGDDVFSWFSAAATTPMDNNVIPMDNGVIERDLAWTA
ncbi:hypothetical protein GCM10012275_16440 [Longimycelium tulufanense]|uniref:Peptidase M10 metallopeptidase domain-containing protein n=1 Tax=Longimycelium tulufanense TaxID=907463 RepID=A0A8J3CDX6_9PSEU|nr:matrixin family metalloprotease [Longimycelium tulufanense]GGM46142.1 hypothetical protein GCM10012275_16440 [Longimycelium tulufanense]